MNHRTLRSRSAVLMALLLAACGNKAGVQLVQDQEQVATTDLTASDGSGFPIASGFKS